VSSPRLPGTSSLRICKREATVPPASSSQLCPVLDAGPTCRLANFLQTAVVLQVLVSADADRLVLWRFRLNLTTCSWERDFLSLKRYFPRMARLHAFRPLDVMASDRSVANFTARIRTEALVAVSILPRRSTATRQLKYFRWKTDLHATARLP